MKNILFALLLSTAFAGCAGYVPGRQFYWDAQVREMCAKDGGAIVYETVELSEDEYKRLGGMRGGLPLPNASSKNLNYPYFYEMFDTKIRESNPAVVRLETLVSRRSDRKVLGRSIAYIRRGGDIPTGLAEGSSFICPANDDLMSQIFKVKGLLK